MPIAFTCPLNNRLKSNTIGTVTNTDNNYCVNKVPNYSVTRL